MYISGLQKIGLGQWEAIAGAAASEYAQDEDNENSNNSGSGNQTPAQTQPQTSAAVQSTQQQTFTAAVSPNIQVSTGGGSQTATTGMVTAPTQSAPSSLAPLGTGDNGYSGLPGYEPFYNAPEGFDISDYWTEAFSSKQTEAAPFPWLPVAGITAGLAFIAFGFMLQNQRKKGP